MEGLADSAHGTKPTDLAPTVPAPAPNSAQEPVPVKMTSPKPAFDPAQPAQPVPQQPPQGAAPAGDKPPFDPSQPATPVAAAGDKPPFDPSAPSTPVPEEHTATKYLPLAGSVIGGIAGAASGIPTLGLGAIPGEVAGAAAGGAIGSMAKDALDSWIYHDEKNPQDIGVDAAKEAAFSGVGQAVGMGIGAAAAPALKAVGGKVGELLSGVPSEILQRYGQAADVIGKMSRDAGGSIAEAADTVRTAFKQSIQNAGARLQAGVDSVLSNSTERIDASPIINQLNKAKSALDMDLPASKELAAQMDEMISTVRNKFDENGLIFVKDANSLKGYLQKLADYEGPGDAVNNAALKAAAVTRGLINEAVPDVAKLNNQQALLITIQRKMNKSLINAGSNESALISAGKSAMESSEGSARNALALQRLSKITGQDMLTPAQNLAVMKVLGNPSLKRVGIGAIAGGAAGYEIGGEHGAMAGATLGGALTSPAALKFAIDAGRFAAPAAVPAANATLGQSLMGPGPQQ